VGRRALRANLALGASVFALLLVPAELLLRRLAPVRTVFYAFDPRALYRPRPFAAQAFTYPLGREPEVALRFDARGYRGDGREPPAGALRVAVFGDSFVEARLTREEHTFPVRLAALLSTALGWPVAAINAGASGYGPDQELRRMEEDVPALAPRLVVVVIFAGNDAGDLVRNGLFRLQDGQLVPNDWQLDDGVRRFLDRPWFGGLALVRAVNRVWDRVGRAVHPPPPPDTPEHALGDCRREYEERLRHPRRVQPLQSDHYDADLALDPSSASAAYKRSLLRPLLLRLRQAAAALHVPLLLLIVPHPTDACRGCPQQVDAARFPDYRRSTLTDLWATAARDEGLAFEDLFPSFWDEGRGAFYFAGDGHWNVEGQERAARLAAARVLAAGWLR